MALNISNSGYSSHSWIFKWVRSPDVGLWPLGRMGSKAAWIREVGSSTHDGAYCHQQIRCWLFLLFLSIMQMDYSCCIFFGLFRLSRLDTLKTLKKRFWFGERTRTQGKRKNKEQTVPFSEDRRAWRGAKARLIIYSSSVRRPSTGRPGVRIWRRSKSWNE